MPLSTPLLCKPSRATPPRSYTGPRPPKPGRHSQSPARSPEPAASAKRGIPPCAPCVPCRSPSQGQCPPHRPSSGPAGRGTPETASFARHQVTVLPPRESRDPCPQHLQSRGTWCSPSGAPLPTCPVLAVHALAPLILTGAPRGRPVSDPASPTSLPLPVPGLLGPHTRSLLHLCPPPRRLTWSHTVNTISGGTKPSPRDGHQLLGRTSSLRMGSSLSPTACPSLPELPTRSCCSPDPCLLSHINTVPSHPPNLLCPVPRFSRGSSVLPGTQATSSDSLNFPLSLSHTQSFSKSCRLCS